MMTKCCAAALLLLTTFVAISRGQENTPTQEELFQTFTETLTNARLVGHFTVIGKDRPPAPEEYTIKSVSKLPEGDKWIFNAHIKYGDLDTTLPLPLDVKWAGDTPVITLTDLTIPTLGTFSARVVIYNGKYAGTWRHGQVGGHLYGVIEKSESAPSKDAE